MFCLNCIFATDAVAVKQLVSTGRSFLKYGVSAVAMAAHKFLKKSNQIFTVLLSLNSLQNRTLFFTTQVQSVTDITNMK